MSQTVEIKVGKNTFFVTKLNAFEALPVFGDLQKELLPALGALLGSLKDEPEGSLKDVNNADLEKAVEKLSAQLDGKSLERWATRLLDSGHIAYEDENGEAVRFKLARDGHIFADFAEVLQLLVVVIKENFAAPLTRWLNLSGLVGLAEKAKP
nr:MAG TPA: tail assembly chaperone protein [Siphoviridae sp. ctmtD6]